MEKWGQKSWSLQNNWPGCDTMHISLMMHSVSWKKSACAVSFMFRLCLSSCCFNLFISLCEILNSPIWYKFPLSPSTLCILNQYYILAKVPWSLIHFNKEHLWGKYLDVNKSFIDTPKSQTLIDFKLVVLHLAEINYTDSSMRNNLILCICLAWVTCFVVAWKQRTSADLLKNL